MRSPAQAYDRTMSVFLRSLRQRSVTAGDHLGGDTGSRLTDGSNSKRHGGRAEVGYPKKQI